MERAYLETGPLPHNNEEHLALAEKETPQYFNTRYPAGGIKAKTEIAAKPAAGEYRGSLPPINVNVPMPPVKPPKPAVVSKPAKD